MIANITMDSRKLTVEAVAEDPDPEERRRQDRLGRVVLHTMNETMKPAETSAMPMIIGEPHPYWVPPHTVTSSGRGDGPPSSTPAPRKSIRCDWRRKGSFSTAEVTTRADDADGDVDVEDPPPRQVAGEHPAQAGVRRLEESAERVAPEVPISWVTMPPRSQGRRRRR